MNFREAWYNLTPEQRQEWLAKVKDKNEYPDTEYGKQFEKWLKMRVELNQKAQQEAKMEGGFVHDPLVKVSWLELDAELAAHEKIMRFHAGVIGLLCFWTVFQAVALIWLFSRAV